MVEQGNGLPELRSIVVVGPDEVIPQGRIADLTSIGNETDYADDATIDRNGDGAPDDSAVSAAFRFGYMLSDDPYGDFDPTEFGFAPDVALGRLVETPGQIQAQVQAFLDSPGFVQPQRSFVTGYDFLSDGADEIFGSLSGAVPGGSSQSRIDETWTAADAAGRPERAPAPGSSRSTPTTTTTAPCPPRPTAAATRRCCRRRPRTCPRAASRSRSAATRASTSRSATPRPPPTRASATGPSGWRPAARSMPPTPASATATTRPSPTRSGSWPTTPSTWPPAT